MTQRRRSVIVVVACCLLFVKGVSAQTLQVIDLEGHSTAITAVHIANSPRVTVSVAERDKTVQFEGVPLATLLAMAGVQLGDALRGPRMTEVLVVTAADGYKVAFALAEVDPAFAVREIILADKKDGKPLDGREGPFRVVAPGDKRPARWIRQVTELKLTSVK
jgi:hypothetical protein